MKFKSVLCGLLAGIILLGGVSLQSVQASSESLSTNEALNKAYAGVLSDMYKLDSKAHKFGRSRVAKKVYNGDVLTEKEEEKLVKIEDYVSNLADKYQSYFTDDASLTYVNLEFNCIFEDLMNEELDKDCKGDNTHLAYRFKDLNEDGIDELILYTSSFGLNDSAYTNQEFVITFDGESPVFFSKENCSSHLVLEDGKLLEGDYIDGFSIASFDNRGSLVDEEILDKESYTNTDGNIDLDMLIPLFDDDYDIYRVSRQSSKNVKNGILSGLNDEVFHYDYYDEYEKSALNVM